MWDNKLLIYILSILLFLNISTYARQENEILFTRYSSDNGLSHSIVNDMVEDSLGFLWFATMDGLNRFDGYTFTNYYPIHNNIHFPSYSSVKRLFIDSKNQIWIYYNYEGVERFDPKLEVFYNYTNDPKNSNSITGNKIGQHAPIPNFFEDSNSDIWIVTESGFNQYIRKKDHFRTFSKDKKKPDPIPNHEVTCFFEDNNRILWISTTNGIVFFDLEKQEILPYQIPDQANNPFQKDYITYMFQLDQDNILLGFNMSGLYIATHVMDSKKAQIQNIIGQNSYGGKYIRVNKIYKIKTDQFLIGTDIGMYQLYNDNKKFKIDFIKETKGIPIGKIFIDSKNNIWAASTEREKGIFKIQNELKNIVNLSKIYKDKFTVEIVQFIKESKNGILWIGTQKDGLFSTDLYSKKFNNINNNPKNQISISHKDVYSIFEDKRSNLWIGTRLNLNQINLKTGKHIVYENQDYIKHGIDFEISKKISNTFIGVIRETQDNKLWFGSFQYKVSLYEPNLERFTNFHNNYQNHNSFLNWSVRDICITKNNDIYFGGTKHGLCKLNPDGISFTYFPVKDKTKPGTNSEWINSISEDKFENLWIATSNGGLNKYDKKNNRFVYYTKTNDAHSIPTNQVRCIMIPKVKWSDSIIWIGTERGFSKFNTILEKFDNYLVDGIQSKVVHGIVEDSLGKLWLSTNKGIVAFEPENKKTRIYTWEDGLQGNEFNPGAYFINKRGEIYFGGTNGVTWFKPEEIIDYPFDVNIVLTKLKIYNQEVFAGDTINGRVLLNQNISYVNQITLKHFEKVVSIEFVALGFGSPNKIIYKYKLDGFDKNWNEVYSNQRYINYSNIPSGKYTLRITSTNRDGDWSANTAKLDIEIIPPFWETTWFAVLLVIFFLIIFYLVLYLRTRSIEKQKKRLEYKVRIRTNELKEVNDKLYENQEFILEQNTEILSQRDHLKEKNAVLEAQKKEISEMSAKIHESDQLKLMFFTNISHEFRTPLTLILGIAEKLIHQDQYSDPEKIRSEIHLIFKNGKLLLKLINQLLDIRKVETGNLKLKVINHDIVAFIDNICQLFAPYSEEKAIHFSFQPSFEKYAIYFDPDKIEKSLFNLISNAFKNSPKNSFIRVSLVEKQIEKKEYLCLSVEDQGYGIPTDQLPFVFERFSSLANKSKSTGYSSGLGLSLVKDLVELHHGLIYVTSELEKGSKFEINLPVDPEVYTADEIATDDMIDYTFETIQMVLEESEPQSINSIQQNVRKKENFNILIIEDHSDLLLFLHKELELRYNVLVSANGDEGLKIAFNELPDLIISDIMLPGKDGLTICKEIKSNSLTSHIPVILLTAKTEIEQQIAGFEHGADDYITKPFSIEILMFKINNISKAQMILKEHFKTESGFIPENININNLDKEFIERFIACVEKYVDDPQLSGDILAQEMGISKANLYKKLNALNGLSVNHFIRNIRLKHAANLLKSGKYRISDVAYAVGFSNPKYFSTCFSEMYSISPIEYMKTNFIEPMD